MQIGVCQGSQWYGREMMYIPTVWPSERQTAKKNRAQLQKLDDSSTDIWATNSIQKYEMRPADLENVCLADFVARYIKEHKRKRDASEFGDICCYFQPFLSFPLLLLLLLFLFLLFPLLLLLLQQFFP
ncbi:hypothetical protein AVEN_46805-1 [Araneus ventricosus]|uniref:Uncharacterized protein n=1 Tax=Araneus ventricosus TaxID=182803 RepID=A0A4Y2IWM2_ARAVE|nr:hypothetical protein AVEN_46805-1 [Araneus ventricosus]